MAEGPTETAEGRQDALAAAFAALRGSLGAHLRRRGGDAAQMDDLVQDVFLKALAAIRAGREPAKLTGWLYTVARTTLIDHHRRNGPATVALDEDAPLEAPAEDDDRLHQALALCLPPLLEELPPIYRDALRAVDLQGQSMQAAADAAGLSLPAIKSRVRRGRALLKARVLACCHVEMSGGQVQDFHPRASSSPCAKACSPE